MKAIRGVVIFFLIAIGAAIVFVLWSEPDNVSNDVVLLGGDIVSMAESSEVDAMWIRNGRIEMLGSADDVRAAAGSSAKVVDLDGATVMPGFIEAHTHPLASALLGTAIDVSGFTHDSRGEIMETLRDAMDGFLPQPWVIAFGWDPIMVEGLEPPTRAELDALSPDKPFVILTQAMHEAFANSAALREAGITRTLRSPGSACICQLATWVRSTTSARRSPLSSADFIVRAIARKGTWVRAELLPRSHLLLWRSPSRDRGSAG